MEKGQIHSNPIRFRQDKKKRRERSNLPSIVIAMSATGNFLMTGDRLLTDRRRLLRKVEDSYVTPRERERTRRLGAKLKHRVKIGFLFRLIDPSSFWFGLVYFRYIWAFTVIDFMIW